MNALTTESWFVRRGVIWILSCGAASLLAATLVAASQRESGTDRRSAAPYTPTRGEWLCLLLNSRQALVDSQRRASGGVSVHFVYDPSKPDTIRIESLFEDGVSEEQVRSLRGPGRASRDRCGNGLRVAGLAQGRT